MLSRKLIPADHAPHPSQATPRRLPPLAERRNDGFLAIMGHELRDYVAALRSTASKLRENGNGEVTKICEALLRQVADMERLVRDLAMSGYELRHPLEALRRIASKLSEFGDVELTKTGEALLRRVAHMERLVNDLWDSSNLLRHDKIRLRKETGELADIVQQAVDINEHLIKRKDQKLTVTLPQEHVHLEVDPAWLVQALSNLLNNGSKYTAQGGDICLTAELAADRVVIRVRDNGRGIPSDQVPRVFEFYFRGENSPSTPGEGIGLALVNKIVELHGGTVEAHSDGPDKGSEFTVILPRVPVSEVGAKSTPERHEPQTARAARTARVLVVDDNPDAAHNLALLLQLFGHVAEVAHTGQEALEMASTFRPEIVLLDINLSEDKDACEGMDGYELTRRLRKQPQASSALIAAVSGYGEEAHIARAQDAGCDHYFVKPVDPKSLSEWIAGYCAK